MGKKSNQATKGKSASHGGMLKKGEAQEWLRVHALLHDFLNQRFKVISRAHDYDTVTKLGLGERMELQAVLDNHAELVSAFISEARGVSKSERKCASVFARPFQGVFAIVGEHDNGSTVVWSRCGSVFLVRGITHTLHSACARKPHSRLPDEFYEGCVKFVSATLCRCPYGGVMYNGFMRPIMPSELQQGEYEEMAGRSQSDVDKALNNPGLILTLTLTLTLTLLTLTLTSLRKHR